MAPAFYDFKVVKTTSIETPQTAPHTYNLTGNNARIYHGSIDNSTNVVKQNTENLFHELRELIGTKIQENENLLKLVTEMEENKGKSSFLEKYTSFIAAAADHISIVTPFIPALTQLIQHSYK